MVPQAVGGYGLMMKSLILLPVRFYRWFISPLIPPRCRYVPTCSDYMIQAVEQHGVGKGLILGIKRFCRCHPFAKTHGHDPVPEKQKK